MSTVDPEKAYRNGRIVLGDEGVLIVRVFFLYVAGVTLYWLIILLKAMSFAWLLRLSGLGVDVGGFRGGHSIPWASITSISAKTLKKKNYEVHTLIIFAGEGKKTKIHLYGSGLTLTDIKSAFAKFHKPIAEVFN